MTAPPAQSAFADKSIVPDATAVEAVLGQRVGLWRSLRVELAREFDPIQEGWSFAGKAHGWSLRLEHRDRAVVYLTPLQGTFRASLAIPERAMAAALEADLPGPIRAIVAGAASYPEGRAVRIEIATEDDVASVVALVRIRMRS